MAAGLEPADYLRRVIGARGIWTYDPSDDPAYFSDWTDEDRADATHASINRIEEELGEEAGYDA